VGLLKQKLIRHPWLYALAAAAACCALGWAVERVYGVPGPGRPPHPFTAWPAIDMWIRWDAGWYYAIATDGYSYSPTAQSAVAFFPLYPLLIRGLVQLGSAPLLAGIAITLLCGLGASQLFHAWARGLADERAARLGTGLLLLWPFAYYLYGAVYADALFLLLVLAAFLALERGHPWAAGLLGAMACATRPIAAAVVAGLCVRQWELLRQRGGGWRFSDLAPALSSLGMLGYMGFLWWRFGDPLAFARTQVGWGQLSGPASWLKLEFFRHASAVDYPLPLLHLGLALLCLGLLPLIKSRLGWGYAVYVAVALAMPLVSSRDFIGLGRYALAAFPCFLAGALLLADRPRWRWSWTGASALLLLLMTARFTLGRYVS
jgi:hypothetical protein